MMPRSFNATIAALLSFVLVAPQAFFMMPRQAQAQLLNPTGILNTGNVGARSQLNLGIDPLESGEFGAIPTSANNFGAETLHTSSGLADFAPAGASSVGCASVIASIAASVAGTAAVVKVLGTGPAISTDPSTIARYAGNCLTTTLQLIQQTITSAATVSSAAAAQALVIDAYVLQPLAFVLSGNLLKLITQGVIAFVIGKANGTGIPQFVADIRASLQTVSDAHALAYFDQYIRSSKSPWNTAILSQLSKEYLNETSLAGFWAANMDTLKYTSPYAFGYLNGNWAQGGVSSWFALTTQFQNNPYMLYPAVKDQLASVIGPGVPGATGARVLDINNGQGVVSWCGDSDGFLGEMTTDVRAGVSAANVDRAYDDAYQKTYDARIKQGFSQETADYEAGQAAAAAYDAAFAQAKAANAGNNFMGVAPGDPCTNEDGTTGTIKTPGSVILASLNKALGGQQDNVVRMGNVGPEINNILANIGVVLKTVNFATQILGGPGSNGIFGVDQPAPGQTRSALQAYANSPGNLGATNSGVSKNAATFSVSGSDMLSRVAEYEAAVDVIRAAANTASTSLSSLITYCSGPLQTASTTPSIPPTNQSIIDDARRALTTRIASILTKVDAAKKIIAAARELVQKIQGEQNATTETAAAQYALDIQTLQNMPPSPADVADAKENALRTVLEQTYPTPTTNPSSQATSSPNVPFDISGGTLVDQLTIISKDAEKLRSSCTVPEAPPTKQCDYDAAGKCIDTSAPSATY